MCDESLLRSPIAKHSTQGLSTAFHAAVSPPKNMVSAPQDCAEDHRLLYSSSYPAFFVMFSIMKMGL